MKIEVREIVIKQEVFIAYDGREFTDRDECREYEMKLLEKTMAFYDGRYKRVDGIESCTFLNAITEKDVKTAIELCNYYGITSNGLNRPGLYMYQYSGKASWINIDDIVINIRGGASE